MAPDFVPSWVKKFSIKLDGVEVSVVTQANLLTKEVHFEIMTAGWLSKARGSGAKKVIQVLTQKAVSAKHQKEAEALADGWLVRDKIPSINNRNTLKIENTLP